MSLCVNFSPHLVGEAAGFDHEGHEFFVVIVKLTYMTAAGHERFALPALRVPVRFAEAPDLLTEVEIFPDTIIIEPQFRRLSLVARAAYRPRRNVLALRHVLVGTPSPAWERARSVGKRFVDRRVPS